MYLNKYFAFNLVAIILYLAYETLVTCLCSHLAKQVTLVMTISSTTVVFFTLESKSLNCTHSFPLKYHLLGTVLKLCKAISIGLFYGTGIFFLNLRQPQLSLIASLCHFLQSHSSNIHIHHVIKQDRHTSLHIKVTNKYVLSFMRKV